MAKNPPTRTQSAIPSAARNPLSRRGVPRSARDDNGDRSDVVIDFQSPRLYNYGQVLYHYSCTVLIPISTLSAPVISTAPRYPIRVVARRVGITEITLRAWERRYAAIEPARS